jgi:hypothetical protein
MVRWAIPIAIGASVGWFSGVVLHGPASWVVPAFLFALWLGYCRVWVRRTYVRRYLRYVRRNLDPQAGPPPGATPVELPIAQRMEAIEKDDFDAIRALYTKDCRFYIAGRKKPRSLELHMRAARFGNGLLGETTSSFTTTLADPREQDGFWLLGEMQARPRRGEPFAVKWVEAWTLTPGHDRIGTRAIVAFTDVAVATRSA